MYRSQYNRRTRIVLVVLQTANLVYQETTGYQPVDVELTGIK